MADQQSQGYPNAIPGGSPGADQGGNPAAKRADFAAFFTPFTVAGSAVILLLLTVLSFTLTWKKTVEDAIDDQGGAATVNGFGIQKVATQGEVVHGVQLPLIALGLLIIFLLIAAAVFVVASVYQRLAAVLLIAAGSAGTLYAFISLFADFGRDKNLLGLEASEGDDALEWTLRFGVFAALFVGLLTLVLGGAYFIATRGPLFPKTAPSTRLVRITTLFRPLVVVSTTGLLFVLLVVSFLLEWRTVTEKTGDSRMSLGVDGFGQRTIDVFFGTAKDGFAMTDVALLSLTAVTAILLLICAGALLIGVTAWKKAGGVLVAVGAAGAMLYAFIGLITDMGAFRDWAGEDIAGGSINSTDPAIGVFLTLLFSLFLLVVAVLYLLAEFGVLGRSAAVPAPNAGSWGPSQGIPFSGQAQVQQQPEQQQAPQPNPQQQGRWS